MTACERARWLALAIAILVFATPASSRADDPVTWPFELVTEGDDVLWISPTTVDNTAANAYTMSYELTTVKVKIMEVPWEAWVRVTDELPPELLTKSDTLAGPLPIIAFDDEFAYPEPPEPPSFEAHLRMLLNSTGYCNVEVTDVFLGQAGFPPDDPNSMQIQLLGIWIIGTVTVAEAEAVVTDVDAVVVPEGGTATFQVKLTGPPAEVVTINVEREEDDEEDGDEDISVQHGANLTFGPNNWDEYQTVTLAATKDADGLAGEATFHVGAEGVAPKDVVATEREDDCNADDIADDQQLADGDLHDCDGNGVPDVCEPDGDGDGVIDACDACLGTAPGVAVGDNGCPRDDCNENQIADSVDIASGTSPDCDDNGVPDECDADNDGDGVIDACDNCPEVANADQADYDGNGAGDACDASADIGRPQADAGSAGDESALDFNPDLAPAACGAGACGVGVVGWLPLTLLGLCGFRVRGRWKRLGP